MNPIRKRIQVPSDVSEGEVFCKWLDRRFAENKNVLGANLGPTGSGKSYRDLRMAELWYKFHFKEDVPLNHICFGVGQAMTLISSGKLRKGDIIIFEEAGVNLGALDFQNKVSKMMTYVLQSFRSMNIAIFFNLPYLSMLNSQARKLLHYSFESVGIDSTTKQNKCKPFFHQVNQDTGKVYKKYPIINVGGRTRKIKRFSFALPSQYLIDAYEKKKKDYLLSLTKGFKEEVERLHGGKKIRPPTEIEMQCYTLDRLGMKQREIGEKFGISQTCASKYILYVRSYLKRIEIAKETPILTPQIAI